MLMRKLLLATTALAFAMVPAFAEPVVIRMVSIWSAPSPAAALAAIAASFEETA